MFVKRTYLKVTNIQNVCNMRNLRDLEIYEKETIS